MKYLKPIVLIFSFFVGLSLAYSQTNSLDFPNNPRTNILKDSSIYMKALGSSCSAILDIPDDLPCSASNLPFNKGDSVFSGQLALSNGYSSLNLIREAIGSNINSEFVDLILDQKIFQIDTGLRVFFKSKNFAGKYVPMSVRAFIGLRNDVNPNVDIFAVEEKGFSFQYGQKIFNKNLSLGVELRALDRTLIKSTFKVSEFGDEANPDLVSAENYKVIFADPSVTYRIPKFHNLVLSGSILNLGHSSLKDNDSVEEPISFRLGASVKRRLSKYGSLRITTEYNRQNYTEDLLDSINLGAIYTYGGMQILGGLNTYGMSAGVYFGIESINAGIVYSSSRFPDLSNDSFVQTVYVQLGWRSGS